VQRTSIEAGVELVLGPRRLPERPLGRHPGKGPKECASVFDILEHGPSQRLAANHSRPKHLPKLVDGEMPERVHGCSGRPAR
jgi:hypothetical protein